MLQSDSKARFLRMRAVFLSSIFSLAFILIMPSCSVEKMTVRSAELVPLYVYGGADSDLIPFMALTVYYEEGSSAIRSARLEQKDSAVYWNYNAGDGGGEITRMPFEGDDYVPPGYIRDKNADNSRATFFYPWFALPGDGSGMDGEYELTIDDYSGNGEHLKLHYKDISSQDRSDLAGAASFMTPAAIGLKGTWEILVISPADGRLLERYDYAKLVSGESEISADIEDRALTYIWGVPADMDCFLLAGPF